MAIAKVYTDAIEGERVEVTKQQSEMVGWQGLVLTVEHYSHQADWYLVDLDDTDKLLGDDTTMWFRAHDIKKAS